VRGAQGAPLPHPLAPEARAVHPRELALVAAALLLTAAPHATRAPLWLALLTVSLYAWRAAAVVRPSLLPSRGLLLAIALVALVGVGLEYRSMFGRTPGIMMLLVFSGLKLLEVRSQRDAVAAVFVAWFLVITNFLYSQSVPTAFAMLAALALSACALVGFAAPQRALGANLRSAGILLAQAAPAALALFVLFPRVPGPLWGLPQDAYSAMTGLSDTMSPGSFSQLVLSDAIAFRADFGGDPPPRRALYWRGPVLWDFDGRTWHSRAPELARAQAPRDRPQAPGRYQYSVLLEPHNRHWLFAIETAAALPPQARLLDDGQILTVAPVRTRMRYEMISLTEHSGEPEANAGQLRRALRLPAGGSPRARALAASWRAAAASDAEIVERAVEFFRRAQLVYTLEPPRLGEHSVDEFLFDARAGFCEHFASAFAFLMRAAGVPARVVLGYHGGDLNPVDGKLTVRQSDAHAWLEVYLAGRGWTRLDPTALAAPARLESGLSRAVREASELPLLLRPGLAWLRSLRYNWEALAHQWNLWVLGYNPERQRELLGLLGLPQADWRGLTAVLAALLGAMVGALALWSLRAELRPDPLARAWQAFCRKLAARGVARAPHEGPRDYVERAAAALPAAAANMRAIAALYLALRYGRSTPRDRIAELRRRVRAFRPG